MSVIIRDMDYPENCAVCKLAQKRVFACSVMCPITGQTVGYYDRGFHLEKHDCPLGHFPEKHGRLIDADALIRAMFTASDGTIMRNTNIDGWHFEMRYEDIKKHIRNAPTIVPAEGETCNG